MICVAVLCGYSLLTACGSDDRDARQVHLMVANHTSPIHLADVSEYLIRGEVIGSPQRAVIDRDTGLAYMVSQVRIAEVFAQRPDVLTQLTSDMTVRVGVSVLDPQEQKSITNFDDLSRIFPTVDDALVKGADVLLFLSHTEYLKAPDPDYEVVGYGVINDTNQVKWKGFPGELANTTSDLETATRFDVITRYRTPGRNSKPDAQQASGSMAGFAAYDESIPETLIHPYWVAHDDLNSLTRSSDIAFVGRITDYTEAVLVVPDDPAEEPDPTVDVYDGVVFTIDELLVGELPAGETQVIIATRVLLKNTDGTPRFRVSASPIEIVRPGIFARNEPDRQSYIVYALAGHKGTPFYATGVYFFNTPGGVAPILANDRIGIGAARPLAGAIEEAENEDAIATEGEGTGTPAVGPGLELGDARIAARTAA